MTLEEAEKEGAKPLQKYKRSNKQLQRSVAKRPTSPLHESLATYLPDILSGWVNLHQKITEIVASRPLNVNIPTGCCMTPKCTPTAKRSAVDKPAGLVADPDQKLSRPAILLKNSLPTVQNIERALGQQPRDMLDDLQKNFMLTHGQWFNRCRTLFHTADEVKSI
ncbi:hypothetical protein P879_11670 [Paragonimus westermani]|uniref:Uncharacterized protein n=1 Tax=Paragonimus westermani TaxID=34504 RepID=A0A8T0D7X0_9TREM|nr:hypothetical protein P879_11670 [Paragonimus westermani]